MKSQKKTKALKIEKRASPCKECGEKKFFDMHDSWGCTKCGVITIKKKAS